MRALGVVLLLVLAAGCDAGGASVASLAAPSQAEIWAAMQPQAERYRIAPAFIFALVAAESNFDPRARNGAARGLLQVKEIAWKTVSSLPYEPNVWDWRTNLEVGIDYLAYSRSYLHRKAEFSYPLLLASFHYGLDYVEQRGFDIRRIPIPPNGIYRKLWAGNLTPVEVPEESSIQTPAG